MTFAVLSVEHQLAVSQAALDRRTASDYDGLVGPFLWPSVPAFVTSDPVTCKSPTPSKSPISPFKGLPNV